MSDQYSCLPLCHELHFAKDISAFYLSVYIMLLYSSFVLPYAHTCNLLNHIALE